MSIFIDLPDYHPSKQAFYVQILQPSKHSFLGDQSQWEGFLGDTFSDQLSDKKMGAGSMVGQGFHYVLEQAFVRSDGKPSPTEQALVRHAASSDAAASTVQAMRPSAQERERKVTRALRSAKNGGGRARAKQGGSSIFSLFCASTQNNDEMKEPFIADPAEPQEVIATSPRAGRPDNQGGAGGQTGVTVQVDMQNSRDDGAGTSAGTAAISAPPVQVSTAAADQHDDVVGGIKDDCVRCGLLACVLACGAVAGSGGHAALAAL